LTLHEGYIYLGKIVRTHGLKGEVGVYFDTEKPERFLCLNMFFIEINQKLIPFFISGLRLRGQMATVKIDGVNNLEEAYDFVKKKIFLPAHELPRQSDDDVYYTEMKGFEVKDKNLGSIGTIETITQMPQQWMAAVKNKDREILIPLVKEFILRIERKKKTIHVNLPDGFWEIF
jgi:16S rRNA processing protein RimM